MNKGSVAPGNEDSDDNGSDSEDDNEEPCASQFQTLLEFNVVNTITCVVRSRRAISPLAPQHPA